MKCIDSSHEHPWLLLVEQRLPIRTASYKMTLNSYWLCNAGFVMPLHFQVQQLSWVSVPSALSPKGLNCFTLDQTNEPLRALVHSTLDTTFLVQFDVIAGDVAESSSPAHMLHVLSLVYKLY